MMNSEVAGFGTLDALDHLGPASHIAKADQPVAKRPDAAQRDIFRNSISGHASVALKSQRSMLECCSVRRYSTGDILSRKRTRLPMYADTEVGE